MLWFILKKVNSTTQVGISNLKDAIEQVTLQKSSNNVVEMLDRMQKNWKTLRTVVPCTMINCVTFSAP